MGEKIKNDLKKMNIIKIKIMRLENKMRENER